MQIDHNRTGRSAAGTYHTATKVITTRAIRAARATTAPVTEAAKATAPTVKAKDTASRGTASKDTGKTTRTKGTVRTEATILAQIVPAKVRGATLISRTNMVVRIRKIPHNLSRDIRDKGIKGVGGVKFRVICKK